MSIVVGVAEPIIRVGEPVGSIGCSPVGSIVGVGVGKVLTCGVRNVGEFIGGEKMIGCLVSITGMTSNKGLGVGYNVCGFESGASGVSGSPPPRGAGASLGGTVGVAVVGVVVCALVGGVVGMVMGEPVGPLGCKRKIGEDRAVRAMLVEVRTELLTLIIKREVS